MSLTDPTFVIAATSLVGLVVVAVALLRGWHGWLRLKERELDRDRGEPVDTYGPGAARIELADLKERIRKLEGIANGVDL